MDLSRFTIKKSNPSVLIRPNKKRNLKINKFYSQKFKLIYISK